MEVRGLIDSLDSHTHGTVRVIDQMDFFNASIVSDPIDPACVIKKIDKRLTFEF